MATIRAKYTSTKYTTYSLTLNSNTTYTQASYLTGKRKCTQYITRNNFCSKRVKTVPLSHPLQIGTLVNLKKKKPSNYLSIWMSVNSEPIQTCVVLITVIRFDSQFNDVKRLLHVDIVNRKILQTRSILQERVLAEFDRLMVAFILQSLSKWLH